MSDDKIDLSAYPLTWPAGRPRTRDRRRSKFGARQDEGSYKRKIKLSLYVALTRLRDELRLVKAEDIVISSNVPARRDGLPYARTAAPEDPGVAVYFRLRGEAHCLACDRWETVAENLNAIAKHVYAIRGQSRWGVGDLAQAFAGYRALPAMGAIKPWWEVLGLREPPATAAEVEPKWRALIAQHHPDRGGNASQASEINAAWHEAERYYERNP